MGNLLENRKRFLYLLRTDSQMQNTLTVFDTWIMKGFDIELDQKY